MAPVALANPLRPALLACARSPRIKRALVGVPVTKRVVDRFVAGSRLDEALGQVREILASGRAVSIDHLGEDTTDRRHAEDAVAAYRELLDGVQSLGGPQEGTVEVSVKLSALGQALGSDGDAVALDNARIVCERAERVGSLVTIDAEDHRSTDARLAIVGELRRDHPGVGTVLQAYLRRTESDCVQLASAGSRIRLCKGAYQEPRSVAYAGKDEVDASYLRCLEILMRGQGYPMVASHDPAIIGRAGELAQQTGRGAGDFEYQMLYGIRDAEQRRLAAAGNTMRVYLPYGAEWYGYFMRRLAERPANLVFLLRALAARENAKIALAQCTRPARKATRAAATRLRTPSFPSTAETWVLTVVSPR